MSDVKEARSLIEMPLYERLMQDQHWAAWQGRGRYRTLIPILLEDMTTDHRRATINFLERSCLSLLRSYEIAQAKERGEKVVYEEKPYDPIQHRFDQEDAEAWLCDTPLYRRLLELEGLS